MIAWIAATLALGLAGCGGGSGGAGGGDPAAAARPDPGPEPEVLAGPLVAYVDPFIGSGGDGFGVGSSFAGASAPFGLVKLGPDTTEVGGAPEFTHCSGYAYGDRFIKGFSHIHLHGTGLADYGNLLFVPGTDAAALRPGYRTRFDKASEAAGPGWYSVTTGDGVRVELAAAPRQGVHRYTWPAGADRLLLVDMGHVLGGGAVTEAALALGPDGRSFHGSLKREAGWVGRYGGFRLWFSARADVPVEEVARPDGGLSALLRLGGQGPVEIGVSVSFVDEDGAASNLEDRTYDDVRTATETEWESLLGRVEVAGADADAATVLYTAVYHSLLMPTLLSDADGRYRGLDQQVHASPGGRPYYSDFSLWDTYRTLHPLLTVLYPEYQRDFLESFLRQAEDGGYVGRWPLAIGYTGTMIGTSADVVVADSAVKGLGPYGDGLDWEALYAALLKTADGPVPAGAPYPGRGCMPAYADLGFCPSDKSGGSVAHTLEHGWDDFGLARLAGVLGRQADAARFHARAISGWRRHYDPDTGFLVARSSDGVLHPVEDPGSWSDDYVEGGAWHYNWLVPQDLAGLAGALGGPEALVARLDRFFDGAAAEVDRARADGRAIDAVPNPFYWHGNEPDIHAPWIYSAAGRPDLAARRAAWVAQTYYDTTPSGLAGNDDCGTLSAWYLFAAAGLFPIAGSAQYLLAAPLFDLVRWRPPSGGPLTFRRTGAGSSPVRAWLGDGPLEAAAADHAPLVAAGGLLFEMSDEAGGAWAFAPPP